MKSLFCLVFLLPTLAIAKPRLDDKSFQTLQADPTINGPAQKPQRQSSGSVTLRMSVETFMEMEGGGEFKTKMNLNQKMRIKELPSNDTGIIRREVRYETLDMESKVQGLGKPKTSKHSVGKIAGVKPFILVSKDDKVTDVEGLDPIRVHAAKNLKDKESLALVLGALDKEKLMSQNLRAASETGCGEALSGKKVGASWKAKLATPQLELELECKFEGWAVIKGERFMLLRSTIQPKELVKNDEKGTPLLMNASGEILEVFDQKGSEARTRFSMKTSGEIKSDRAGSKQQTSVLTESHFHPL